MVGGLRGSHAPARPLPGPAALPWGRPAPPARAYVFHRGAGCRHRQPGGGRAEPLVLRGLRRPLGRARRGGRGHPELHRAQLRPPGPRPHEGRQVRSGSPQGPAQRRCRPGGAPGGHGGRPGTRRRPHRRQVHPGGGPRGGRGLHGGGEPHGQGFCLARHGQGLPRHQGRPRRSPAGGPEGRPGRGRRHPWAAERGPPHREGNPLWTALERPALRPAGRGPPRSAGRVGPPHPAAPRLPADG